LPMQFHPILDSSLYLGRVVVYANARLARKDWVKN